MESTKKQSRGSTKRISVAPMMQVTDSYFRYMIRLVSRNACLYTEMIPARAALESPEKYLRFFQEENPVVLQLGGSSAPLLASASALGEKFGYDEINLNCGCPSDRVSDGGFGASLMLDPQKTANLIKEMKNAVSIPVTVKHRIATRLGGIQSSYEDLRRFVDAVISAGCSRLIVHARSAVLGGLSPALNRSVPPLHYETVERLKAEYPDMPIELNGGIDNAELARQLLERFDGVMLGRAVARDPSMIAFADGTHSAENSGVFFGMLDLLQRTESGSGRRAILGHMMHLFQGRRGARLYRRTISEGLQKYGMDRALEILRDAFVHIEPCSLGAPAAQLVA